MLPVGQGRGRFDAPAISPVWYLAETATHAVAEILQSFRGQEVGPAELVRFKHPLALVEATLPPADAARVLDLCDPAQLLARGLRPDALASRNRTTTQRISQQLATGGGTHLPAPGFRWWSALDGDWHSIILYHANLPAGALAFGTPAPLVIDSPAVVAACDALAITRRP
jgi:hypothetical protein